MASIYTYNLLTPAASGADVLLSNSTIEIAGAPFVNLKEATLSQFNDPIVEVRKVQVWTPSSITAGTAYALNIVAFSKPLGRLVNKLFSCTAVAGDNATTVSNKLIQIINLDSEIPVTASGTGGGTVILTADAGSSDFTATNAGAGTFSGATATFVNSAGTAVSFTTGTSTGVAESGAGVNNLATITIAASATLAAGMVVNYTLGGTDSIILADGTTVTSGTIPVRIGGTVSTTQFQFGPATDSNIESMDLDTAVAARTVTLTPAPPRGTAAELASRGIVGASSSVTYAEVKLNWLEVPVNGGAAISKSHSVFVDSTTTPANYTAFRYVAINAMRALTTSTSAFGTTASVQASSIN
jgi:hypothetical protein